jgi:hypothetical protein
MPNLENRKYSGFSDEALLDFKKTFQRTRDDFIGHPRMVANCDQEIAAVEAEFEARRKA